MNLNIWMVVGKEVKKLGKHLHVDYLGCKKASYNSHGYQTQYPESYKKFYQNFIHAAAPIISMSKS